MYAVAQKGSFWYAETLDEAREFAADLAKQTRADCAVLAARTPAPHALAWRILEGFTSGGDTHTFDPAAAWLNIDGPNIHTAREMLPRAAACLPLLKPAESYAR